MFSNLIGTLAGSKKTFANPSSTSLAAAYSVRQFRGYSGPLIKVQRASDSAQMDVYAASNGFLNTASITAWAPSQTVYVIKWYDQSGNARHLDQTTVANMPTIANSSGVISTVNGKPALEFTRINATSTGYNYLYNNSWAFATPDSAFTVVMGTYLRPAAGTYAAILAQGTSSSPMSLGYLGTGSSLSADLQQNGIADKQSSRTFSANTAMVYSWASDGFQSNVLNGTTTNIIPYFNGYPATLATGGITYASRINVMHLGGQGYQTRDTTDGKLFEVLIYRARISDRAAVENDIGKNFGVLDYYADPLPGQTSATFPDYATYASYVNGLTVGLSTSSPTNTQWASVTRRWRITGMTEGSTVMYGTPWGTGAFSQDSGVARTCQQAFLSQAAFNAVVANNSVMIADVTTDGSKTTYSATTRNGYTSTAYSGSAYPGLIMTNFVYWDHAYSKPIAVNPYAQTYSLWAG